MKNSKPLIYIASAVITVLFIAVMFLFFYSKTASVVYVNNKKLFDDFRMTKEIKLSGEKLVQEKQKELQLVYEKLQAVKNPNEKALLANEFEKKRSDLEMFNQTYGAEQTEKIWERINSYSVEFSKSKNYKLIIGSESNRSLIYGDESLDVTNDLLKFINKKYEGFK